MPGILATVIDNVRARLAPSPSPIVPLQFSAEWYALQSAARELAFLPKTPTVKEYPTSPTPPDRSFPAKEYPVQYERAPVVPGANPYKAVMVPPPGVSFR